MGRLHQTKPNKHPELALEVALCSNAYNEIGLKAPNAAGEQHTTMVTAMTDTGAAMCLVGRCVTIRRGISRHDLSATMKRLVGPTAGKSSWTA